MHLWDNLFYQSLKNSSDRIRDTIIALIRADNFLRAWTSHSEIPNLDADQRIERFAKLADASILLPNVISKYKKIDFLPGDRENQVANHQALENKANFEASKYFIALWQGIIAEFKSVEIAFLREQQASYEAAWEAFEQNIARLKASAVAEVDPATGEGSYPQLVLPKFSFVRKELFDRNYLAPKLSTCGIMLFEQVARKNDQLLSDLIPTLQAMIAEEWTKMVKYGRENKKTIRFNGYPIEIKEERPSNQYFIKAFAIGKDATRYTIMLVQYAGNSKMKLSEASLKMTNPLADILDTKHPKILSNGFSLTHFFADGVESRTADSEFTISIQGGNGTTSETYRLGDLITGVSKEIDANYQSLDGEPGTPFTAMPGVKKVGVGAYKRVEQKVCCYVAGDVSHIENIMAREFKERTSRTLVQSESTFEESEEREIEKLTDYTTTDRYEMQSEVSKVLDEQKAQDWGASASVQGEKFGLSIFSSGYFNSSTSSSVSTSFSESESFAKEVTARAMERIVQKVSRKRTSRILQEHEDTNRHGYDNTKGTEHVVGIYRWVDKIYENNLVNYGKRLMYDFMLPEPSKLFKKALEAAPIQSNILVLTAPTAPSSLGLNSPADVAEANYGIFAAEYGATITAPIDPSINVGLSVAKNIADTAFVDTVQGNMRKDAHTIELKVPANYACTTVIAKVGLTQHGANLDAASVLFIGGFNAVITNGSNIGFPDFYAFASPIEGVVPISIRTYDTVAFNMNFVAICVRKQSIFEVWQQETYAAIIDAYQKRLAEYNKALAAQTPVATNNSGKDIKFNPSFNRTIEMRELKRIAIELMTQPFGYDIGIDNYYPYSNGHFRVQQTGQLAWHSNMIRFFEQAFDWEIMSYTFFPYFWANQIDWIDLIKTTSSSDFVFQSFLQAGMAQATLPVRPGFEQSVMFYLDTGTLWNGTGFAVEDDNLLYLSVMEDLELHEGEVEATWTTRLPTALTIIQTNAAALDANGLPCFCEDGTPIAAGNSILQGGVAAAPNAELPAACIEPSLQLKALTSQYTSLRANYNAGNADCHVVISDMQAILVTLGQLMTVALRSNCPMQPYADFKAIVVGEIAIISATCI